MCVVHTVYTIMSCQLSYSYSLSMCLYETWQMNIAHYYSSMLANNLSRCFSSFMKLLWCVKPLRKQNEKKQPNYSATNTYAYALILRNVHWQTFVYFPLAEKSQTEAFKCAPWVSRAKARRNQRTWTKKGKCWDFFILQMFTLVTEWFVAYF